MDNLNVERINAALLVPVGIRKDPRQGRFLVADAPIEKGVIILRETAILKAPEVSAELSPPCREEVLPEYMSMVARPPNGLPPRVLYAALEYKVLSPENQELFSHLHDPCSDDATDPALVRAARQLDIPCSIFRIFDVNNFNGHVGYVSSLLNHACPPHHNITVTAHGGMVICRTLRDIAVGEALCPTYIAPTVAAADRTRILEERWRFRCVCPECQQVAAAQGSAAKDATEVVQEPSCAQQVSMNV